MSEPRKKLDLTTCIAIANGKRAKNGKELIRDKRHLATLLPADELKLTNVYMVLYRSETDGYLRPNKTLIAKLREVLDVKEKELVVDF